MILDIYCKLKNFKIIKKIDNRIVLLKSKNFNDIRGIFLKIFSNEDLKKIFNKKIIQINYVKNKKKGFIRGFHYQTGIYSEKKLIRCIKGKIEVIIIQCNKNKKDYLKPRRFILSEKNRYCLVVPENFANGYQVLENNSELVYISDNNYNSVQEKKINPLDPKLKIKWRIKKIILSKKDKSTKYL